MLETVRGDLVHSRWFPGAADVGTEVRKATGQLWAEGNWMSDLQPREPGCEAGVGGRVTGSRGNPLMLSSHLLLILTFPQDLA